MILKNRKIHENKLFLFYCFTLVNVCETSKIYYEGMKYRA